MSVSTSQTEEKKCKVNCAFNNLSKMWFCVSSFNNFSKSHLHNQKYQHSYLPLLLKHTPAATDIYYISYIKFTAKNTACFVMERRSIATQLSIFCCGFRVMALSTISGLQTDIVKSLATNKQLKRKANTNIPPKQKVQHG